MFERIEDSLLVICLHALYLQSDSIFSSFTCNTTFLQRKSRLCVCEVGMQTTNKSSTFLFDTSSRNEDVEIHQMHGPLVRKQSHWLFMSRFVSECWWLAWVFRESPSLWLWAEPVRDILFDELRAVCVREAYWITLSDCQTMTPSYALKLETQNSKS